MDTEEALRIRIEDLEHKLFESHLAICWGDPRCRCGTVCYCPHRQVCKPLPKCCADCKKMLRRAAEAQNRSQAPS